MNKPFLDQWAEILAKGDWIMTALMGIAATLWFCLAYRALLLQRGSRKPLEDLLDNPPAFFGSEQRVFRGFVVEAVAAAGQVLRMATTMRASALESYLHPLVAKMNAFRSLVTALVALAPMAGLLGTVLGMMTMFSSIGDSNFSSQSGGITNGIAQALYATEVALLIAVPCLVVGQILNRREDSLKVELSQLVRLTCARPYEVAS